MNSSSSASRPQGGQLTDDAEADALLPISRRQRRQSEQAPSLTAVPSPPPAAPAAPAVVAPAAPPVVPPVQAISPEASPAEDEDEEGGPSPRPAPRVTSAPSINGPFDDRTGLFEGPPGASLRGEPGSPGSSPSFTPPGGLSGFGSSAFRSRDATRQAAPTVPAPPAPAPPPDVPEAPDAPEAPEPPEPPEVPERPEAPEPSDVPEPLTVPEPPDVPEPPNVPEAPDAPPAAGEPTAEGSLPPSEPIVDQRPEQAPERVRPATDGPDRGAQLRLFALVAVPVVVGLIALGLAVEGLVGLFSHPFRSLLLLVVSGVVLYGLVVAAIRVRRTEPAQLMGAELTPPEQPRIWGAIGELSVAAGVGPVDRIVLDGGTLVRLGRAEHRRELLIGLPLLIGLDPTELRALIARELVDERSPEASVGRLTSLGPRLELALGTLGRGAPRYLLLGYQRLYRSLAQPARERHDAWCDEQVALVVEPGALERAHQRSTTVDTAWSVLLEEYLPLSALAGRRPSLTEAVEQILRHRLTPADERRGPGATELLDGGPEGVRRLEGWILVDDDPQADWAQIVESAGLVEAELGAARLARASLRSVLTGGPDRPVTFDEVLTALADGEGPALVEPLLRPAIPSAERPAEAASVLNQHLNAFVSLVLMRAGLARSVLSWVGAPELQRLARAGEVAAWIPWDLTPLIADAAADAAGAQPLRARLESFGAGLGEAVFPAPAPPRRVLSAFTDVELCGPFEVRRIDLLVYDDGLLLAPGVADTPLRRLEHQLNWQRPGAVSAATRIVRLAEQLGSTPQTLPGGWWIDLDDVTMSQLRERRTGLELQLRVTDGAGATIRATPTTSLRGTPVDDLSRLLPGLLA